MAISRATGCVCSLQLGFLSGLTGDIPRVSAKMQQLGYLDVAGNMLTGPLPAVTSVNMINLRLAENFLTGTVPASYGEYLLITACHLLRTALNWSLIACLSQDDKRYCAMPSLQVDEVQSLLI